MMQRHPALHCQAQDSIAIRSFLLSCGVLHTALHATWKSRLPQLGHALLRAWPKVRVATRHQKGVDSTPFYVVDVDGQNELEKHVQNHTMSSPFEVVLLRLKLPVEGIWDCPGGHVSILRLGKDLVYVDSQRWLSAKLLPPESSMQHFLLHGQLPRGGEVFLRFPSSSELQVVFRLTSSDALRSFTASRIPKENDAICNFSFVMIQCYHAFGDGYCFSPIASDLFGIYDALHRKDQEALRGFMCRNDGVADALKVLQGRLEETLLMDCDPNRHSLRGSMWSSWFNGYSSTFTIEGDSLAVLKAVAQRCSVPMNHLLLAIVIAANARASKSDVVEMTLYVPMRDASEAGMVGLFADWRDIRVPIPQGSSIWTVPGMSWPWHWVL
eukprot:symbB.v1.2.039279.t1/scaffold6457.1/size17953/2